MCEGRAIIHHHPPSAASHPLRFQHHCARRAELRTWTAVAERGAGQGFGVWLRRHVVGVGLVWVRLLESFAINPVGVLSNWTGRVDCVTGHRQDCKRAVLMPSTTSTCSQSNHLPAASKRVVDSAVSYSVSLTHSQHSAVPVSPTWIVLLA